MENIRVICHLTTAPQAGDERIFLRQASSMTKLSNVQIFIAGHGHLTENTKVGLFNFGSISKNRWVRILKSQYLAFKSWYKIRPNIWQIHDPELLFFALILCLLKKKVVWDAHEDYFVQFRSHSNYRSYIPKTLQAPASRAIITLLKLIDRKAFGIICATPTIASKYRNRNCVVVGNEAHIQEFAAVRPKFASRQALFLGTCDETQSFRDVVRAIQQISQLNLVVAGKEISIENYDFAERVLGTRFKYLGWLDRSQLIQAIDESIFGFITYQSLETYMANNLSPNKLYEFSAAGLPCVVTPITFLVNWGRESNGAYISKEFTSFGIENAILELINSEEIWNQKSQDTRKWSITYGTWSNSEERLLEFYANLLSN